MSSLVEKVVSFLRENPNNDYSLLELTTTIKERYKADYANKAFGQLAAEISSHLSKIKKQGKYPQIKEVEGEKPKRRYWSEENFGVTEADIIKSVKNIQNSTRTSQAKKPRKEHDLYDSLIEYLKENGISARRIREGASKNKNKAGANWHRHPDIVGVEGRIGNQGWEYQVSQLAKAIRQTDKARIWSFEVKTKIANIGELRRNYSQAILNSSWAHCGYLCVEEITRNEKMDKEMHELVQTHGIGIILLNHENPKESKIHIESADKDVIDLDFCNRLVSENTDFRRFIEHATKIFDTGDIT